MRAEMFGKSIKALGSLYWLRDKKGTPDSVVSFSLSPWVTSHRLLTHQILLGLLFGLIVINFVSPAFATIIAQHSGANDPTTQGFTDLNSSSPVAVGPVNNDLGLGIDAWFVDDTFTTAGSIRNYIQPLTTSENDDANNMGWRLTGIVRVATSSLPDPLVDSGDSSIYVAFMSGQKFYEFWFGSEVDGDPQVQIPGLPATPTTVQKFTFQGAGGGYHRYDLIFDPNTGTGDFFFDGSLIGSFGTPTSAFDTNIGFGAPGVVRWGSASSSDTGRGHYALVEFEIDPTTQPIADAGPDQTVPEGTLVTLNGSGSTAVNPTYSWSQIGGSPVTLTDGATPHPTFTAPNVTTAGETLTFELIVCEGTSTTLCSDPDTVDVHVTNINQSPIADAGLDQTVQENSPVTLDGTGSYDPDLEALTYQWTQVGGSPITLINANTALPSFTAPMVGTVGATLTFQLIVTDVNSVPSIPDTVTVVVTNVNQPPVADAGTDQTVNENTIVTLNGTGSFDPDSDPITYAWTQVGGQVVILNNANTATPNFTAPLVGAGGETLIFQLIVSDGETNSNPDTLEVHVQDVNDPPVCALAQPSVGTLRPPNHTLQPVIVTGISDPNNQDVTITYTTITQDEPVNGLGDGDTAPDAVISGQQVMLRAERASPGNGRVYQISFVASDGVESCSGSVFVGVPHNQSSTAVDDGQLYDSTQP